MRLTIRTIAPPQQAKVDQKQIDQQQVPPQQSVALAVPPVTVEMLSRWSI
jgi:hypothetical protein